MRCDRIQELLKSDYLDGRAAEKEKQSVLEHLKHCSQCRQIEKELLEARAVLQGAEEKQAPERLWQNIRQAIVTERLDVKEACDKNILERLKGLIRAPRPVFALASAVTVIIFIAVFAGLIIQNRQHLSVVSIDEYSISSDAEELIYGLGTNIEEYFL